MGYFQMSYRVLYSDTMALGWHHFLTNFHFQCEAREHFFFGHLLKDPETAQRLADLAIVTHEGYSRNLAQVPVGGVVGVLLSYEDAGPCSLRFCFRVIRQDGAPVACGYQKLACFSMKTGAMILAPPELSKYELTLREKLVYPSFAERVNSGVGLESIFDEDAIRLGKLAAAGSREGTIGGPPPPTERPDVVLVFPGTGSAYAELLGEVAREDASAVPLIREASAITARLLGAPLDPFLDTVTPSAHLERYPELVQPICFLGGVLTARMLTARGLTPSWMMGHSMGELAALCAAGAFSIAQGVELVAERVRALEPVTGKGGMLALAVSEARARALVQSLGQNGLDIAVVNGPEQTVVSGPNADLERLDALAGHLGLHRARLNSAIAFHNRMLRPCVETWNAALARMPLGLPRLPVYSPMERGFYHTDTELARALPSQFVRPLAFGEALATVVQAGARTFVECGGGNAVSGIGRKMFQGREELAFLPTFSSPGAAARNLPRVASVCNLAPARAPVTVVPQKGAAPVATRGQAQIAVVGMGCVLPGAFDPAALWKMVLEGRSSISAETEAVIGDYLSHEELPVPDKTYSPMRGRIDGFPADPRYPTAGQAYLAEALRQALAPLGGRLPATSRLQVLLGSTADGVREYEDGLLASSLAEILQSGDPQGLLRAARTRGGRTRQLEAIEEAVGRSLAKSRDLSPWLLYDAVARDVLGDGARVLALDAACASSLYAVGAAVRALEHGECDLALAGGVFWPGPANSCLFAQFRGLSKTGSRPLDVTADGVVFSEGAGLLALKRLEDAEAAGDRVLAVIQGVGMSSDGRSPSVMEPREAGQLAALKRAYASSGIDPASIQYLEAHATATVVGDAVEVKAAGKVFAGSPTPVTLGSVKANFGHTGWAAGVTSLIKMISAMQADTLPPQALFTRPSPRLEIEKTPFDIPTEARPWPKAGEVARRVAVNGFGFGGANAHVVVEAAGERGAAVKRPAPARTTPKDAARIAVVSTGALFPVRGTRFSAEEVELPPKIRILPDILDHMDRSNVLAVAAAARALDGLPDWKDVAEDAGVIIGIEGKTGRGIDANLRIHRDRLQKRLSASRGLEDGEVRELREIVDAGIDRILASGPYTLPGLMPNVVAGRVTAAFDFRGPNIVLDAHRASLAAALEMGASWLRDGDAKVVLAGALHGCAHPGIKRLVHASRTCPESRPVGEGCLLVALTTEATAQERGWPVHAILDCGADAVGAIAVGNAPTCLLGAEGALELASALSSMKARTGARARLAWPGGRVLTFTSQDVRGERAEAVTVDVGGPAAAPVAGMPEGTVTIAADLGELEEAPEAAGWLTGRRVLVICAGELPLPVARALAGARVRMLGPEGLDLTPDSLPDQVLVVRDLAGEPAESVCRPRDPLMELAFGISKSLYEPLAAGKLGLTFLCTGAWTPTGQLHPATGLFAGFGKSLAGELPESRVRVIHTGALEAEPLRAILERELAATGAPVEVAYRGRRRLAQTLRTVASPVVGVPLLRAESVVLAVGGARGVTAVLVETLLERYGCTVALIGRSDPVAVPAALMQRSDAELGTAEAEYLAAELAKGKGEKPAAIKARWESLKAAREAAITLRRLQALPGRVVYLQADVNVDGAVDAAVETVAHDLGRVDFVLFGAGVQVSKLLSKRTLDDFRRVIGTKLGGLGHVLRAVGRHQTGAPPHVHLLSSATGLLGAPGAQDYAAANEALNRLALVRSAEGGEAEWGAVAWTWWRGVGMGTAFDQLPAAKRLPSISREQGKRIFAGLTAGRPAAAVLSVFDQGDAALLPGLHVSAGEARARTLVDPWPIERERYPFLADHKIDGVPTMPGAYLIDMSVRSALKMRPGTTVARVHDVKLMRFVKAARPFCLRAVCRVLAEEGPETYVQVRMFSDFVHADGTVLRQDDVHATATVVVSGNAAAPPDQPRVKRDRSTFIEVPEPYQHPDSRVFVAGPFHRLGRIFASEAAVQSSLEPSAPADVDAMSEAAVPVVLLDALFRITTFEPRPTEVLPVFVPTTCDAIYLPQRKIDPREPLTLEAGRRTLIGNLLRTDWAEARDQKGHVVLRAEGLVGLRVGQITMTFGSQERGELP